MLDLRRGKLHRLRVAVLRELVDDRAAGIAQRQQFGHFVEGLAGSIVARVPDVAVRPTPALLLGQVQVRVAAGDHQRQHREIDFVIALLPLLQQHGVNMAFQVVDGDQRLLQGKRQRLGITDTHQQRSRQSGPLSHGQRVDRLVGLAGLRQRLAHHGHNRPQMLARGQLRHHAAIGLVGRNLREHDVGDNLLADAHHGGRGLVTGALDAEYVGIGMNLV